ncbi:thiosulfate/3-mercaptopyruvate sulfurtransferase [Halogranum amylolyticum]|uniref:Thiosulfate/3-mercaptopyruvate sulfurtransferase n=1 Tax=Halogranum amylolyticum TaxID=660520 RepID=A0A1H8R251_9EURY|nr:sulfurtransferase [Halogranum amylolyticum]SEO60555.1 thiosulfate/3-mercaptopyruvate sulfurtransferase [Halogranum amylolyticum]
MYENLVVSADWLADHLDDVRVVDVRDSWEFDGIGHVPGAVNVPFDSFRSDVGDEGMLPGADVWTDLMNEAGIDADDTLVAYDDTHGVFAARFLVTAELYGHRDLHLLDGDFSAWSREHEVEREAVDHPEGDYEVRDPESSPLVDYEYVLDAVERVSAASGEGEGDDGRDGRNERDGPETVVVDTREAWEYEEGHLPGAVQLDWLELVDDESRGLKPRAELESLLAERGITPDKEVVLYCNTARRISHTYVVLRQLGYEHVAFYEGSLTEWDERGGPVEGELTGESET